MNVNIEKFLNGEIQLRTVGTNDDNYYKVAITKINKDGSIVEFINHYFPEKEFEMLVKLKNLYDTIKNKRVDPIDLISDLANSIDLYGSEKYDAGFKDNYTGEF